MKKSILLFFAITAFNLLIAQSHPESYVCYRTNTSIAIDGVLDESEWGDVAWTNRFVDIEGDKNPLPTYATRVKMMWDEEFFYVAAELEEPHIWANLKQRDTVIFYDNDFEVFIDPDGDNHLYYEFEMNALNTVWDLMIAKPYRDGAPAINAWDIQGLKSAVAIYGTVNRPLDTDEKWTVEIAFPWEVLKECAFEQRKPKAGEQWRVNFSRVNWDVEVVNGKYKKKMNPETGKPLPEHNWVWSPQGVIAMHQPETWGYVQFSSKKAGEGEDDFVADEDFQVKMALIEVYQKQLQYYSTNGVYLEKLESRYPIKIEITAKQFLASCKGKSGKTWYINQESKIWNE